VLLLLHQGSQTLRGNHLGSNLRRAPKVALEFLSLSTSLAEAVHQKSYVASQLWASDVPSPTNVII